MKNKRIFFRLSIYFLASETLLSIILIVVGYHYVRENVFERYRYQRQYELNETIDEIHSVMNKNVQLAETLASEFSKKYSSHLVENNIPDYFQLNPNLYAIRVVTREIGNPSKIISDKTWNSPNQKHKFSSIISNHENKLGDYLNHSSTKTVSPYWGQPFYFPQDSARLITFTYPVIIEDQHHLLHTTIYCVVSLNPLVAPLKSKNGYCFLTDENNLFIYHPNPQMTGKKLECANLSGKIFNTFRIGENGYKTISPNCMINKKSMALYWPIKATNWFVISVVPLKVLFSELYEIMLILILLIIIIATISIALMIFFSNKLIVLPVSELAKDSQRIAEEEGLIPNYHLTDLEAIAEGINKMKDSLVNYRQHSLQNSIDKELLNRELLQAQEIEMGMVPTKYPLFDERDDLDCYGKLLPAKIVGGDLFDIFLLDDNVVFMLICDTMGKGIPAAMFAVMVRTYIRSVTNPVSRLGKIMESLNDELFIGKEIDMFATVFMAKLDLLNGRLTFCNAGHPKPLVLRKGCQSEQLELSHGFPIGIRGNQKFTESVIELKSGDSLVAYTDGVTDHYNRNGDFFGESRLISTITPLYNLSSEEIVNKIFQTLSDFKDGIKDHDDTTVVVLKYLGARNH